MKLISLAVSSFVDCGEVNPVIVGAWFIGETVKSNVDVLVLDPSETCKSILVVPFFPEIGDSTAVQFGAVPEKVTPPPLATKLVFDEM